MSFTDDLLSGLAQLLEDAGVATWRPTGADYEPGDPAPVVRSSQPASPDQVITLTSYAVDDDPTAGEDVVGVQVRTRGDKDPRTVDDLDDDVFDVLHGLDVTTVGEAGHEVRLALVQRRSGTYLGADNGGRHQRSSNYYVTAHRPTPNRS